MAGTRAEEVTKVIWATRPYKAKDDTSVHDLLEYRLKLAGFTVLRRVAVPNNGYGRRGYVDLMVYGDPPVWIEIDDKRPTLERVDKLLAQPGQRLLILCRGNFPMPEISGIDRVINVR